jgi:hypothetical protein
MFGAKSVAVPVVDGSIFRGQFGCSAERPVTLLFASFSSPRLQQLLACRRAEKDSS